MKVSELMSSPARTCCARDSLEHAAQLLWDHDCGILPVVDGDGRALAVITDRDVCMGAYTRGGRLAELHVADSMSSSVVKCRADDDIGVAAQRMVAHAIRRLPVTDEIGKVIGVLSMHDFVLNGGHHAATGAALRVLAASCRRRARGAGAPGSPAAAAAPPSMRPASGDAARCAVDGR